MLSPRHAPARVGRLGSIRELILSLPGMLNPGLRSISLVCVALLGSVTPLGAQGLTTDGLSFTQRAPLPSPANTGNPTAAEPLFDLPNKPKEVRVLSFDSLPANPWVVSHNGGSATVADGILTFDTSGHYEFRLEHELSIVPMGTWHQHVDNANGWAIETRLRIDPNIRGELGFAGHAPFEIWANDHTNCVIIGFGKDGMGIVYPDLAVTTMNTTDDFHTYRIESQFEQVRVYVDGVLRIDHTLSWRGGGTDVLYFGNGGGGSGRSYWDYFKYEVYVDEPSLLMSPNFVVGKAGEPLVFPLSAEDPDGDPIDSLFASSLPAGAEFELSPDKHSGVVTWNPSSSDVGSRELLFQASSAGVLTVGRAVVSVWSPELPPNLATNPSFETDLTGWNGYGGATVERILGGHDGDYALRATGSPVLSGSFGVNDSPDVIHHTLAAGLVYRYTAWVRSPTSQGSAVLRVHEYRNSSGFNVGEGTSAPVTLSPGWQLLTLDYTTKERGTTLDFQVRDFPVVQVPSEVFETDEIAVRNITGQPGTGVVAVPPQLPQLELRSRVVPSPIRSSGTLSFATSRPGSLRVEILDLAGRRVRRLLDRAEAPAGRHELSIPGDLDTGLYFYRIQGQERMETGRFAVLR